MGCDNLKAVTVITLGTKCSEAGACESSLCWESGQLNWGLSGGSIPALSNCWCSIVVVQNLGMVPTGVQFSTSAPIMSLYVSLAERPYEGGIRGSIPLSRIVT